MFGNLKKIKISKYFLLFILYTVVLFVSPFLEQISKYNSVVVVLFAIMSISLLWDKNIMNIAIFIFFLLFPVLLFKPSSFLYFIYDYLNVLIVVLILDITARKAYLKRYEYKLVTYFYLAYIVAFLILLGNSTFYSETNRYLGLMKGSNLSSLFIISILVYIVEYYKNKKTILGLLCFSYFIFFICSYFCKTRSIFFFLPYLFLLTKEYSKSLCLFTVLIITFIASVYWQELINIFRFQEDASFLTRLEIYTFIFDQIKQGYFLLPNGFNACNEVSMKYVGEAGFTPHNDFLRYYYDWGVIWIIFLGYIVGKCYIIYQSSSFKKELITIFIFLLSNALHNTLFIPYVWLPIFFVLILLKQKQEN